MIAALATAFKFRDIGYLGIIAALFGMWQLEKANALADREAQAKAIIEFQQADAERTRALEDAHAAEVEQIRKDANARHEAIARAPASTACIGSPSGRAFIDGLRKPAGDGDPHPAR